MKAMNRPFRHAAFVAAVVLAVTLLPAAGSGYRTDYDFPGHGDDWYGRYLPDTRRDFPANPVDLASDGDDFGRGYEQMVASLGYGPPLAATQDPNHEYRFRFGDRLCDPEECYVDSNCDDGVFCNGPEACRSYSCISGTAPSCDDDDLCTSDRCDTGTDACAYDPLADPGEVSGLFLSRPDPGSTVASLSWSDQAAADSYNVYRSEQADLSDLTCYQSIIFAASLDDDGMVGANDLYNYLVNSNGCGGVSTLGNDSGGAERTPLGWCP